jgi:hypothetical protein
MSWTTEVGFSEGVGTLSLHGPALGPIKPPIQWVPDDVSLELKRPDREADH